MRQRKTVKDLLEVCEKYPGFYIHGGGYGGEFYLEGHCFYYDPTYGMRNAHKTMTDEVGSVATELGVDHDVEVGLWGHDDNHMYNVRGFYVDNDAKRIILQVA